MTITSGPNLGLMINAALAEQYYNEMVRFLRGLDGLIQPNVNSRVASLPTSGMVEGSRYLNTTDNKIYRYTNYLNPAAWEAFTPVDGWSVWSTQDQKLFRYKAGAWAVDAGAGGGFTNPMTDPGDLIVGGASGEPTRLAKGAAGKILSATANGLAWIDAPSGGGGSAEKYTAISPSSNALALTDAATTVWGVNLSSNAAITLPTSTGILGLAIIFTQDSTGNRTVTWPSSITWNGGSAPVLSTAAGSKTLVSLLSVDGGATWLGLPLTVASGGSGGSFTGGKLTSALDEADSVAFSFAGGQLPISSIPANTVIVNPGGGTGLTSMDAMSSGVRRILKFNYNGMAVVHDATKLIMPGGVTVATTIGDVAEFLSLGGGNWFCLWYTKYDGKPLVTGSPAIQPVTRLYSQNPVNLGATTSPVVNFVYYDTTVSSLGTAPSGTERTLIRTGSDDTDPLANTNDNGPITLAHSANLRLPGGANIVMGIGDSAKFVSLGSGVWVCEWFKKANGTPVVLDSSKMPLAGGAFTGNVIFGPKLDLIGQATTDLMSVDSNNVELQGVAGPVTSFGTGVPGAMKFVTFGTSGLVIKHTDGTIDLPGQKDITARQYDWLLAHCIASNNWRVRVYSRRDGSPVGEFIAPQFTLATLPGNPAQTPYREIWVTDATGGPKKCFANPAVGGWCLMNTNTVVS